MTSSMLIAALLALGNASAQVNAKADLRCARERSVAAASNPADDGAKERASDCFDGRPRSRRSAESPELTRDAVARRRVREPFPASRYGEPLPAAAPAAYRPPVDPDAKKENPKEKNITPYQGLVDMAQILMMIASILLLVASVLVMLKKTGPAFMQITWQQIIRGLAMAALAIAFMVIAMGVVIMAQHDQKMQGLMFIVSGGMIALGAYKVLKDVPAGDVQRDTAGRVGPTASAEGAKADANRVASAFDDGGGSTGRQIHDNVSRLPGDAQAAIREAVDSGAEVVSTGSNGDVTLKQNGEYFTFDKHGSRTDFRTVTDPNGTKWGIQDTRHLNGSREIVEQHRDSGFKIGNGITADGHRYNYTMGERPVPPIGDDFGPEHGTWDTVTDLESGKTYRRFTPHNGPPVIGNEVEFGSAPITDTAKAGPRMNVGGEGFRYIPNPDGSSIGVVVDQRTNQWYWGTETGSGTYRLGEEVSPAERERFGWSS